MVFSTVKNKHDKNAGFTSILFKMIISNYEYGICELPENCMAYKEGYRYAAYRQNIRKKEDTKMPEFFKTWDEVEIFLGKNKEYVNLED